MLWLPQVLVPQPLICALALRATHKASKMAGLVGIQGGQRRETLKHALRALEFLLSGVFGFAGRCGSVAMVTRTVASASASANTIIMMAVATVTLNPTKLTCYNIFKYN